MDKIVSAFLQRNIPDLKDSFTVEFEESSRDFFRITAQNGKIHVKANNYISAFHGIYCYLKNSATCSFPGAGISRYISTARLCSTANFIKR